MTDPSFQGVVCGTFGRTEDQQSRPDKFDNSSPTLGIVLDSHRENTGEYITRRVNTAWHEVQNLRGSVARSRLGLREHRVGLRQERGRARELEAQLWKNFQSHWDGNGSLDKTILDGLYSEVDKARDELGPKEEHYNELEDDLDMMEYKLEKKEDRFYRQFPDTPYDETGKPSFTDSSYGSGQAWSLSSTSEHTDNSSSPSNKYLSKIGDANIIRERLSALEAERSHYLDLERERDAMGHPLYQPNVEFLDSFSDVHASYLEELRQIEDDLGALRIEADLEGNVENSGPSSVACLDFTPKPSSVRQRINQWILDNLTKSRLERARHKAILDNPELDDSAWLCLVRRYWENDNAAHPLRSPPGNKTLQSGSAGTASPEADIDIMSLHASLKAKTENLSSAQTDVMTLKFMDQNSKVPPKSSVSPTTDGNSLLCLQAFLDAITTAINLHMVDEVS